MTCVTLVGLCLIGCLVIKDRILMGDANPKPERMVGTNTPTAQATVGIEVVDELQSRQTSVFER
jgi:hypothetical protein